ncbi:MAG: hypothetical protein HYZ75_12390 [Elusimicrobia bacterium]|nr:hypothetical protein [Elusimicrobiota bacterium]
MARRLAAAAILLTLAGAARAQAPDSVRPDPEPGPALKAALKETARELRKSETGRRLLGLTEDLRVVERPRRPGTALRYEGGERPALVVDSDRAPGLSPLEFELLSVVERWKAAAALPAEVADAEMAARQAALEHALEKVSVDPDFAKSLRGATVKARESLESRRKQRDWARRQGQRADTVFPGTAPADALARLAWDLYLFSEDAYLFYREAARSGDAGAPTFDQAVDFLDRHEIELGRLEWRAGGEYAVLDGRLYPAGPARVAAALGREGLSRLGERLGDYRGAAREGLLKKVNAWLRALP